MRLHTVGFGLAEGALVATCLGVKMTGVAKCLGSKMSGCQNVLSCMQWHNVWVVQCLGGKMSCCQNVWMSKSVASKCPVVKMSGAEMSQNPDSCYSALTYIEV